jgi:hypothetical protein
MLNFVRKFYRRTDPRRSRRILHNPFVWTSLLLLFGGSTAARENTRNAAVTSPRVASQIAIADFDGDLRPDLVSIQAGSNSSGSHDYWIQFQLSRAGRQSIRLVAPAGGLTIEARDVNGDHAVDLVLVTAWFRQPVAILLNDGHGSFSRVEPTAFPEAFSEPTTNWASASHQATDAVDVPPQSRTVTCPEARALPHIRSHADSIPPSSARIVVNSFLVSHAGRAPPFGVPHF